MASTFADLNISKNAYKEKLKHRPPKSIKQILQSLSKKDARRGFIPRSDLTEALQENFGLTQIQAAIEIRSLINKQVIYEVPCHLSSCVAVSIKPIASSDVYCSDADNQQIRKQTQDYVKALCKSTENKHKVRGSLEQQKLFQRHRQEVLEKK